ncbi:MAG TPA: SPFH domain-containing protein, partial [Segetibacter sp.]
MLLIILGITIVIAASTLRKMQSPLPRYSGLLRIIGSVIIIIGIFTSCVIQVNAGTIGVKSLFGKIQNDVLYSGLHFVNPLVEVKEIDVRTQNYTMSSVHDEGDKTGDDAIRVLTSDGLEVIIDLTVLYRVQASQAPRLVRETGIDYKDKIVRPVTRTKIRDNSVYYTAID